jgi:hypothetical protein
MILTQNNRLVLLFSDCQIRMFRNRLEGQRHSTMVWSTTGQDLACGEAGPAVDWEQTLLSTSGERDLWIWDIPFKFV